MKPEMSIFRKSVMKFKFYLNLTKITGTLHEDLRTFMSIARSFLLRMRNVSDKSCRVNQNTYFMFNKRGKIWWSQTGHR